MDLSKFSDADLQALKGGDLKKLSDEGLEELRYQQTPAAKPRPLSEDVGNVAKSVGLQLVSPYVHGLGNVADLLTGTPPGPESHASRAVNAITPEALKMRAPELGAEIDPATAAAEPELQALPGMQRVKEAIGNFIPGKVKQFGELAADFTGLRRATGTVAGEVGAAADTAVNAAVRPSAAAAENIASNPAIARAREAGFQLTGNDVRRAVPSAPDAQLPGSTRQAIGGPTTVDTIQRTNAAHATQTMAEDVGLANTRAIDPEEMSLRVQQEANTMQRAAASGGTKPSSPQLQRDLEGVTGANAATREAAAQVRQQAEFYQQQYGEQFNGPQALQSVRALRARGYKQLASDDANQLDIGHANLSIADALEQEMKRNISVQDVRAGVTPESFDQARQQLAKLHELEAVTQGGQVSPAKVLNLRKNGAPLSGAADEVAHAAGVAPEGMALAQGAGHVGVPTPTHLGLAHYVVKAGSAVARRLPGMNPASESFQTANYGPRGAPPGAPAPMVGPPTPAPGLERLAPPPGTVSQPVQGNLPLTRADFDQRLLQGIKRRQRFVGEPQ